MKTFNRFIWFTIFCFAMFFLAMALIGCGSKKKLTQKTQFSTVIAKVKRVSELSQNDIETDISVYQSNKEKNVSVQENFQGEVADISKEATLTVENLNGKKMYRYTNFKNVRTGSKISESQSNKETSKTLSEIDRSKSSKDTEVATDIDTSGSEKIINKQKDGKFPWWWIIAALIVYLIISYFRKTLNPLGWIK